MQVAVPMARSYTKVQYAVLKNNKRPHKRAECDDIEIDEDLAKELWQWIPLINGLSNAPWYKAAHFILRILADSDSSSRRYAAEFCVPGILDLIVISGDFDEWECSLRINVKEGLALLKAIRVLVEKYHELLKGSMIVCRVDSMVVFHVFENVGSS